MIRRATHQPYLNGFAQRITARQRVPADYEWSLDLFAGGGGWSRGYEAATGYAFDHACNHDHLAIECHRTNHPATDHHEQSVWDADPRELEPGRQLGYLHLSPDCFPAGTLVLTWAGYRPIESIREGDLVLTHRSRWRRVVATMRSRKPVVRVRVQGHPGGLVCSSSHKHFAARRKGGEVGRVPASELGRGDYLAVPRGIERAGALVLPWTTGTRPAWFLGRFVADGWASGRHGITITVGAAKAEEAERELAESGLAFKRRDTATAVQFIAYSAELARWLEAEFGRLAHGKRLPAWLFGAPEWFRAEFLEGYLAGDGWDRRDGFVTASTVSPELAIGIRTLAETLGYTVSAYQEPQRSSTIEGRDINVCPWLYTVKLRANPEGGHRQQFDTEEHRFYPVRGVDDLDEEQEVFNITVDEDHSYVVEGVVTWNCTDFSKAKGGRPVSDRVRGLAWVALSWMYHRRPRVVTLENVEEFRQWSPLDANNRPIKERRGETFDAFVACMTTGLAPDHPAWDEIERVIPSVPREALERGLGYDVDFRELRACDYGAPTIRKRFFLIARCDGKPIQWPEATHGDVRDLRESVGLPGTIRGASLHDQAECNRGRGQRGTRGGTKPSVGARSHPTGQNEDQSQPNRRSGDRRDVDLKPYVTAAECIDFSIPCPSIFLTPEQAKAWAKAHGVHAPRRPLKPKTEARIARGLVKFVLEHPRPFIVPIANYGGDGAPVHDSAEPLRAIAAHPKGGQHAVAVPYLAGAGGAARAGEPRGVDDPSTTVLPKDSRAVVTPYLSLLNHAGDEGRNRDTQDPMRTLTSRRDAHAVVAPYLVSRYGERDGQEPRCRAADAPAQTVTPTANGGQLVAAWLAKHYGGVTGVEVATPAPTITQTDHNALSTAHLLKLRGTSRDGQTADAPSPAITAGGNHVGLVTGCLVGAGGATGSGRPKALDQPAASVMPNDRRAFVAAFLASYYSEGSGKTGRDLREPTPTIPTVDRHQLVTVLLDGVPHVVIDIGMRMVQPFELLRCQFGEYAEGYVLQGTKAQQGALIGNSVPPHVARAIVKANYKPQRVRLPEPEPELAEVMN